VTISKELQRAYSLAQVWHPDTVWHILADALRDTLAQALKAEFYQSHDSQVEFCVVCQNDMPRMKHAWTDTDWQAEADRQLRGK
jgi:hypothetical protein